MEQPANQPSLLSLTALTVGHTILKSTGFPSGPAETRSLLDWSKHVWVTHAILPIDFTLSRYRNRCEQTESNTTTHA